ncbi:MAG: RDD family protein [Flavobacteriaceae bacterium]|nr:RDD family protein [Flavobacteriaceae bacterium]
MDSFQIETAQNIQISQQVAGIGDRVLAFIIDILVIFIYYLVFVYFIIINMGGNFSDHYWLIFVLTLPIMLYSLLLETFFNGQTVGKMALNIRVVKRDGTQPAFSNYLIRWLLRILDILLSSGGLAVLMIMVGGKGQRLGDLAAGTAVIKEGLYRPPSLEKFSKIVPDSNYQPVFLEVGGLKDQDARNIRKIYYNAKAKGNHNVIVKLHHKITEMLQIKTDMKPIDFVETILTDYQYFSERE